VANWLFLKGVRAHTARCEIRYRQPLAIGTRVLLKGRLVRRKGKVAFLARRLVKADDRLLVAEAEASFVIVE
jgi:acyl-CoA thioesterase FadM